MYKFLLPLHKSYSELVKAAQNPQLRLSQEKLISWIAIFIPVRIAQGI